MGGETAEMSAPWTLMGAQMAGAALAKVCMPAQQLPGIRKALTQHPQELCQPGPQVLPCMHLIPGRVQ